MPIFRVRGFDLESTHHDSCSAIRKRTGETGRTPALSTGAGESEDGAIKTPHRLTERDRFPGLATEGGNPGGGQVAEHRTPLGWRGLAPTVSGTILSGPIGLTMWLRAAWPAVVLYCGGSDSPGPVQSTVITYYRSAEFKARLRAARPAVIARGKNCPGAGGILTQGGGE